LDKKKSHPAPSAEVVSSDVKSSKKSTPALKEAGNFPVVGIGASAGGLEAFMELFRALPADTGMAFVLIQHLSPQHFSMLSTFIQQTTKMNVDEVHQGAVIAPNHVYVIPPNTILEVFHKVLHLRPIPAPHAGTRPVDTFFTSLARDLGNLAVGVILSGTGTDGSVGLKDIKADGGITFVQDPKEARFDGMPSAAIGMASPDHVLSVENISLELAKISKLPFVRKQLVLEGHAPSEETEELLRRIFILVRSATKIDFSHYKYPTIIRRINRRMVLHRVDTLKRYLAFLQATPVEVNALFEDLLINVTDFFRDSEAFEALKSKVFPEIIKNKAPGTAIRIWVPGCSTGEEVYSLAIALLEFLGDGANKFPIQIYGTDICNSALKVARRGIYPESACRNLSPIRSERFFQRDQGGLRVSKNVRDCCIFSSQDVTSQPPINRLDLLSCRNLMIYLGAAIQKKVMETFYFALSPNGFLMLGSSETVGSSADLFSVTDKKNKIYGKKGNRASPARDYQEVPVVQVRTAQIQTAEAGPFRGRKVVSPVLEAERLVLEKYAPAWVLIDQNLDIIQFRGPTGNFIEPASGHPSWNLMKMIRRGLSPDVRILIHAALKEGVAVSKEGLKLKSQGTVQTVAVEVTPFASGHCLVIFMERSLGKAYAKSKTAAEKPGKLKDPRDSEILALTDELNQSQKSLQTIIDDQNASNEEMQSSNEEVLSANEELQSANEELETAKEELQSTNEELTSLNDELSSRNRELDSLNNDLTNVLSNANVSIVMVGSDLRIRRFTPMAEKLLKLIANDVGRNLTDINLGFKIEDLESQIADVIAHMKTIELECQNRDGRWYSLRIRPYKTVENRIEGAVIVFVNIDDAKVRERLVQETQNYSDGIIQTVRDPLVVLDQKLCVERANKAFYDFFKLDPKNTLGRFFYEIGDGHWDNSELRTLLEEVLPKQKEVRDFKITKKISGAGNRVLLLNARALVWEGQLKLLILISLHDLSAFEGAK
jgi:two-component system CheB/CheR fusion protein